MATEQQLRDYLKRATTELADARQRLALAERRRTEPIAIVGMSCRYPGGADSVAAYWELLREGRSGVGDVPAARWDMDEYFNPDRRARGGVYTRRGALLPDVAGWDAEFFGHSPREALRLDPQQRLLAELVWEALEDAGMPAPTLAGTRTGVLVGFLDFLQYGRLELERTPNVAAEPHFGQGVSASVVAGRIAYQFDLRGPAITVDTACSSSLIAVHLAVEALRRGECDTAVAAGTSLVLHPDLYVQACATSMLSPDGTCKTFDAKADGYVMGEGGGVVVLERLSTALEKGHPIRAIVRGSATNQDGRSNGLTAPSRAAQAEVIRRALAAGQISPDEVDYVEAHGSGTRLGDAIELSALHDVFGGRDAANPLRVGAVKTNIGHTLAAAGIAGLIKAALSLENGQIPPNLNYTKPARSVAEDGTVVPVGADPRHTGHAPRLAGVSAFGWSGSNAHVVLEAAPARESAPRVPQRPGARVLTVSAAGQSALAATARRLGEHLDAHPDTALGDLVHTQRSGRASHDFRHAVVAGDLAEARGALAALAERPGTRRTAARTTVAFLLPGTGDHYRGLGRGLYRDEPVFAAAVDACAAVLSPMGVDVAALVSSEPGDAGGLAAMLGRAGESDGGLGHAEIAHPFLFTVEYALARLLDSWGVRPDLLIGYSLGEYTAACLAGVFTLPDALRVVVERARLIAAAPAGRMVAVAADEARVRAALPAHGEVGVAAVNGPAMTVLSGPSGQVDAVAAALLADGVACRPLNSAHAFHSTLLEPARDKLAELIESVPRAVPKTPVVSNRTGDVLTDDEAVSARYWADHLVQPVRFADSVATAAKAGVDAYVELGAGQTLGGLVRQNAAGGPMVIVGTLPGRWSSGGDERAELLGTCARLWETGVDIDWTAADPGAGELLRLPTYPWQRQAFWPEHTQDARTSAPLAAAPADLAFAPSWRQDTATGPAAALRLDGTLVVFADADGIGTRLAEAAESAGTTVVEVRPGRASRRDGRVLTIDTTRPAEYRQAFAGSGPLHVVHLWSLDAPAALPGLPGDDELRAALRDGHDTLLHAVQAIGEESGSRPVRLLTVTRGANEVLGGDAVAPHRSVVHGLGRAVQHEYKNLTWTGVDLDPDAGDAVSCLSAELTRAPAPDGLLAGGAAWRRGRRWVKEWAPVPTADEHSPWRADGAYLITGGTRGLGRALARHLVGIGVRDLALLGRTADADFAELEDAGARVLPLAADAGDPDQLRAALRACRAHFGTLTGVVHAAGLPAGGLAQRRTVADSAAVLAPKVLAMGPLAELFSSATPAEERPELLVLYSSAVTSFGGIGEGDYCAANTVLDACAEALSSVAPSARVVSVAWGPWQHDTWQAKALDGAGLAGRVREYRGRWGFPDAAGCAFLDRIAGTGRPSVLAVRQPLPDLLREWATLTDITALAGAVAPPEHRQRFPRPALRAEFTAPRTPTETAVAEVWGAYLGIEQVGVHDPFFDLGGNSLLGMAMVLAVEKQLRVTIPPAVLFEHPTVAAFAAAVDGAGGDPAPGGGAAVTAGSSRGARRRQARESGGRG